MPNDPQTPQIKSLQGLKNWGLQTDQSPTMEFRREHPWIVKAGDLLSGGATNPTYRPGPVDLLVAASPALGAGVAKLGEMGLPGLKRAVLRPDALESVDGAGGRYGSDFYTDMPITRRQFLDKSANNDLRRAKRDLPLLHGKAQMFGDMADNDPNAWTPVQEGVWGHGVRRPFYPGEKHTRKLLEDAEMRMWESDAGTEGHTLQDALGINALKEQIYDGANDASAAEGPIYEALHGLMKRFGVK